jgi:hypothetical protein
LVFHGRCYIIKAVECRKQVNINTLAKTLKAAETLKRLCHYGAATLNVMTLKIMALSKKYKL